MPYRTRFSQVKIAGIVFWSLVVLAAFGFNPVVGVVTLILVVLFVRAMLKSDTPEAVRALPKDKRDRVKEATKLGIDIRFLDEYRTLSKTPIGKEDAVKLFQALRTPEGKGADQVIVRRYMSMPGRRAEELMQVDAQVLHKYGYVPTSQSFAEVNALTSGAGMGYLTVTYVKTSRSAQLTPTT